MSFKHYCEQVRREQAAYFSILPVLPLMDDPFAAGAAPGQLNDKADREDPTAASGLRKDVREWLLDRNTPPRERKVFLQVAERTMRNLLRLFFSVPLRRTWAWDSEFISLSDLRRRVEEDLSWVAGTQLIGPWLLPVVASGHDRGLEVEQKGAPAPVDRARVKAEAVDAIFDALLEKVYEQVYVDRCLPHAHMACDELEYSHVRMGAGRTRVLQKSVAAVLSSGTTTCR